MDAEICLNYSVELNVAVKLAKLSSIVTGLSLLVKSYVLQVMTHRRPSNDWFYCV